RRGQPRAGHVVEAARRSAVRYTDPGVGGRAGEDRHLDRAVVVSFGLRCDPRISDVERRAPAHGRYVAGGLSGDTYEVAVPSGWLRAEADPARGVGHEGASSRLADGDHVVAEATTDDTVRKTDDDSSSGEWVPLFGDWRDEVLLDSVAWALAESGKILRK